MNTISVNNIRMAYRQSGAETAPALLLIHGFPLDSRFWAAQLRGLAGVARVIAPDLRGHGRSDVPPGPYSMEAHADDLAALLDGLGVAQAVVAGLSMGGYIALAFWRRHPGRVRGIALLDTRAEADSPQARNLRGVSAATVRLTGARVYAEGMLPRLLAPASLADARISARALTIMAEQPVNGIVGALGGLRDRADSRPTLASVNVPALVLVGAEDVLTPPADAQALADGIPGARLVIVPRAGHLSPLEAPRPVNAALRRFMGELPPGRETVGVTGNADRRRMTGDG